MYTFSGNWNISGSFYPKTMGPEYTFQLNSGPYTNGDAVTQTNLGRSFAFSGNTILIGSELTNSNAGGAHLFEYSTTWINTRNYYGFISPNSAATQLGRSVALYGDWMIVGLPKLDKTGVNQVGGVYIYKKTIDGWPISPTQIIYYPENDSGADFGFAVDINGGNFIVGAPGSDVGGTNRGAAYIYKLVDGSWTFDTRIVSSVPTDTEIYGRTVSISGNHVAVGAPGSNGATGYIYTYHKTSDTWSSGTRITGDTSATSLNFGFSIKIRDNRMVVGSPGATLHTTTNARDSGGRLYYYTFNGSTWVKQAVLQVSTDGTKNLTDNEWNVAARLGWAVDLHPTKDVILAGAVRAGSTSTSGSTFGKAYIFEYNQGNWGQSATTPSVISAPNRASNDYFGYALAFGDGDTFGITTIGRQAFFYYTA
jgi:hypothetical protein